jgi:hypothetical protein
MKLLLQFEIAEKIFMEEREMFPHPVPLLVGFSSYFAFWVQVRASPLKVRRGSLLNIATLTARL